MLGPGEFFEGLALGGREFFSGTLGNLYINSAYLQYMYNIGKPNACMHDSIVLLKTLYDM